jgi:MFS family permease
MSIPESLSPLRDPVFRLFFLGRAVSMLGSSMAPVALAFGVLDVSNSAAALGTVLAARSIPMAAFMLLGGVIADRFSRSVVLRLSHVGAALTQGAVAVVLIAGVAELWMLVVLEFFNGTVVAFTFPALQGVIPQLVRRDELQRANALPAYVRENATSMLQDLREGWVEFAAREWVWVVVAAFGLMNAIHAGIWYTLGPTIAKDTIGERGWGLVLSAEAAGFFVMSLVLLKLTLHYPLRAGMLCMVAAVLPMLTLGLSPQLVLLVTGATIAGACIEVFGVGWSTALHEHVPEEMMSRVFSYDALGSFVAIPIGQLLAGPAAHLLGVRTVIVGGAVLYALIGLSTLLSRSVRDLERLHADAG